jgi:hypothetical protein
MNYYCSNCKLKVIVSGKTKIKACSCNASIIAEIVSNLKGTSKLK